MAHQEAAFLRPILAFDTTKQYNGTFTATMNSNGTFSYTLPSTPTSNAAGSDMQVTFSTGNSLDNAISRLSGMEDQYDGTVLAGYQYLGLSQVVQEDRPQPGIDLTYIKQDALGSTSGGDRYTGLDEFGRVVDQNWTPLDSSRFQSTQDRLQYSYDADGNVLSKTDLVNSGNSQTYTYDNLNRLTGYSQGGGGQSYSMDALGNILTYNGQTRTFNGQNEIASGVTDYSGNKIQYDPAGEVTTYIPSASSPDTWMTYDAWGRVVRIGGASSSNVWEWLYYDANGNRTSINNVTGGISYNTTYSPSGQPLEDDTTQGSTSGAVTYVWGQLYVNDLVSEDQTSQPTHNHFYADQDANFDVTSILWYSGSKRASFTYDPFGTLLSASAASQNDENILWQGGQYDYVTSTYRFGARIYIPQIGVWNRPDPAAQGDNLYEAMGDSPADLVDPSGAEAEQGTAQIFQYNTDKLYNVLGPDAMSIGWIEATDGQFILSRFTNPAPPAMFFTIPMPSLQKFIETKEFRNMLVASLSLQVDCKTRTIIKAIPRFWQRSGYTNTPFVTITPLYARGRSRSYKRVILAPDRRSATLVALGGFQVNAGENYLFSVMHGHRLPFAWSKIEYTLDVNGRYTIRFGGSYVPSRSDYVSGTQVGGYSMAQNPSDAESFSNSNLRSASFGPGIDTSEAEIP